MPQNWQQIPPICFRLEHSGFLEIITGHKVKTFCVLRLLTLEHLAPFLLV